MEIPLLPEAGKEPVYPINFFLNINGEDGQPCMEGTPGLKRYSLLSEGVEVRGSWDMDGVLYSVGGNTVYKIVNQIATACTGTLLTSSGPVWMRDNGTQVMIVDDSGYGYTVTGTTVTQITDADFPRVQGLAYQDGYFMTVEKDTSRWWISGLYDGTTWAALEYENTSTAPDDAVVPVSDHREVHILGEETVEAYYNSGNAAFPFTRISSGHQEVGIGAVHSPAQGDNTFFWLSNKYQVLRAAGIGGSPVVVSTPKLTKRWQAYSTISDAIGYCMDYAGFTWYVLIFPGANETWALNVTTGRWHQWSSYPIAPNVVRHRSNCHVLHDGKNLVGDYQNGWIYEVDQATYTDDGEYVRGVYTFGPIYKEAKDIIHNSLQIQFKAGVGLETGTTDPQAMIQWSDDDMRTWSNQHWTAMGKIGEYDRRSVWRRLGRSRRRFYQVIVTDKVQRVIKGIYFDGAIV